MTGRGDDIESLSKLNKPLVDFVLAPGKNPTSSAKNVWRKARAMDGVTQGKSAQHSADRVVLVVDATGKNSVAEIDEDILACLPSINNTAPNPHAHVPHEKVFEIDATAPSVIRLDVAVIYPIISCENVRAQKRDVEFPARVPLRARRWSNLLHFLA